MTTKTFVKCYCDMCGVEIHGEPSVWGSPKEGHALNMPNYHMGARVRIDYANQSKGVDWLGADLCTKCKIEIMEAVLDNLKEELASELS